jgi:hypothetical protein
MRFDGAVARFCLKAAVAIAVLGAILPASGAEPIRYGFLWHMHQPNYYPYETITSIASNNYYTFNVLTVHNDRNGPYTTWPRDAVQAGLSLPHLGAQVSFTGALIENLNVLEGAGIGGGIWNNWKSGYITGAGLKTTLNNPRLDMVAFGFHHPLMPLLDQRDIRMQVKLHKQIYGQTWGGAPYSKGMFPAENAFSDRIIPALVAEGIQWVMVDNIHFDRACVGYPHTNASNLFAPNKADQINPNPALNGGAWVQLQNVWAPSLVSAPFGYQPHKVQYVDPGTGAVTMMTAVPTARYEGNEDARGGYGAFLYGTVMNAYLQYNTDAAHPMFVMLHHDGDNYGGGTDSYYHSNFQNMVSWDTGDPNYECTTVDDYLQQFPVGINDVIHVEPGSWSGADNGDPEFKKWLGDPNTSGWSPDRNSWAVMTAAKNRVFMADDIAPAVSMQGVLAGNGTNTEKAWHFLLCGQASDYWYWDGSAEPWDSNVTRACNQAVSFADPVIAGQQDRTPPAVFIPQREPYNPGGMEWGSTPQPSDFDVWTYAYDVSGIASIELKWRIDNDGQNPIASIQNETYAGGSEVGPWQTAVMSVVPDPVRPANILAPAYKATQYSGRISGPRNVLIDYYVEATDAAANVTRTDIQHVWVGNTSAAATRVATVPDPLAKGQNGTVIYDKAGGPLAGATTISIHYGFDNWASGTITDAPMALNSATGKYEATIPMPLARSQFDCVFNNGAGTWDNNNSADWHLPIQTVPAAVDGWPLY